MWQTDEDRGMVINQAVIRTIWGGQMLSTFIEVTHQNLEIAQPTVQASRNPLSLHGASIIFACASIFPPTNIKMADKPYFK